MDAMNREADIQNLDGDLDVALVFSRFRSVTCVFLVELRGIEPAAKSRVNCGNVIFDYAIQREMTRSDLRLHRKVLMASTPTA